MSLVERIPAAWDKNTEAVFTEVTMLVFRPPDEGDQKEANTEAMFAASPYSREKTKELLEMSPESPDLQFEAISAIISATATELIRRKNPKFSGLETLSDADVFFARGLAMRCTSPALIRDVARFWFDEARSARTRLYDPDVKARAAAYLNHLLQEASNL
ncbi:hypothetical protein FJZ40_00525 [Candidatus Shapirobacteria bacterium]|nr:hypothetical protein [Candidatus Shapirobacteria bacterium]